MMREKNFYKQVATILIVTLILPLSACVTSSSTSPTKQPMTNNERSSHSSGLAYRQTSVVPTISLPPQVKLDANPSLGNATAKIAIVEYSDYECSYCRGFFTQVFPELKKQYIDTGIVRFIHKDLPLRKIHPQAMAAAMAANCAGEQGRFWEMHRALFTTPSQLSAGLYLNLAQELKLDRAKFSACLNNPQHEREILRDMEEATRLGITGTPSFLVGKIQGETLTMMSMAKGVVNIAAFAKEIDSLSSVATPETK